MDARRSQFELDIRAWPRFFGEFLKCYDFHCGDSLAGRMVLNFDARLLNLWTVTARGHLRWHAGSARAINQRFNFVKSAMQLIWMPNWGFWWMYARRKLFRASNADLLIRDTSIWTHKSNRLIANVAQRIVIVVELRCRKASAWMKKHSTGGGLVHGFDRISQFLMNAITSNLCFSEVENSFSTYLLTSFQLLIHIRFEFTLMRCRNFD